MTMAASKAFLHAVHRAHREDGRLVSRYAALAAAAAGAAMFAITPSGVAASRADLAHQLTRERAAWTAERADLRHRLRSALSTPDAEVSMRLAGIAYGQDWRALRSCALSEGYRTAERHQTRIPRPNSAGSGAFGPWQFMPSTWRTTPFAGLDMARVDAQAMATAWMWSRGRRGEWAGAGC